jgi:hypothetical protein
MPTVSPHSTSPNIGNLVVGRGFMSIQLETDLAPVDCGNVTEFKFQVKPTLLEHYSSREGVQTKDLVVVTRLAATLSVKMEEMTARNMAFALLATPQNKVGGSYTLDALTNPLFYASVFFTATNVVGPQWALNVPLVIISPTTTTELIAAGSGTWGTIELQMDVLKDPHSGQFIVATASDINSP